MSVILHVPRRHGAAEHIHIEDNNSNVYEDTLANFALDYGSDFPKLPQDDIGREYIPNERHFTHSADLIGTDHPLVWGAGDAILAGMNIILAAKDTRTTPPPRVYTLDELKTNAKSSVDSNSEQTRLKYVTRGSTQAMTYQEKGDEAADYVAAGYPVDLSSYPFIQAEVNATGNTATQAADNILVQKSAWIAIGAAVEEVRIGGKINIDAATDEAGVEAAQGTAITALELI